MDKIVIKKLNESTLQLETDRGVLLEISEFFTFDVPGARFMPSYKSGQWDGRVRLVNRRNNSVPYGLLQKIIQFCADRQYEIEISDELKSPRIPAKADDLDEFLKEIRIPKEIEWREYQVESFKQMIRQHRGLLISPTGSGKSFMMYLMLRYFLKHDPEHKVLVVVPSTQLVEQLKKDFVFYSSVDPDFGEDDIHQIYSGKDKTTDCPVVISTWQSIFRLGKDWFEPFGMYMVDEVHGSKSKSLTDISAKMTNAYVRIGTTGTLTADDSQVNELTIEGSFGPQFSAIKTKDLMDQNFLAELDIQCLVLKYPELERKAFKKITYQEEVNYLVTNEKRNKFITNLAVDQDDTNTLVLFQFVEKHGKPLFKMIQDKLPEDRKDKCYYISGEINVEKRERIRALTETQQGAIIVASIGTFSTGIDLKNLENIIFAHPTKSQIRVLQSIGRGLRISNNRNITNLFDITDDVCWKKRQNYTFKHGKNRINIYNKEKFNFNVYPVTL